MISGCDRISDFNARHNNIGPEPQKKSLSGGLGVIEPTGNLRTIYQSAGFRPNVSVEKLFIDEGTRVAAGEVLAHLSGFANAKTKLNGLILQRIQEYKLYDLSRYEVSRQTRLASLGASTDEVKRSKMLEMERIMREIVRLDADITNTKADLNDLEVKSPINGTILKLNAREGEHISPVSGLLILAPSTEIQIRAEIYENNIQHIMIGDRATITSQHRAFPGIVVCRVKRINSLVESTSLRPTDPRRISDARVVKVILEVPKSNQSLLSTYVGSTVNVAIDNGK